MLTDRRFITELLLKRSFNHNTTQHQTVYFEILFADLRLSKMTILMDTHSQGIMLWCPLPQ